MDLQAIEARLAAATPGPWDFYVLPQSVGITVATIHSEHGPRETCWTVDLPPEIGGMGTEKDAEFIAHAPEDIRALLDEVKAVRDAVARHPDVMECSEYSDDEPVSCGWKRAYEDVVWALNEGPIILNVGESTDDPIPGLEPGSQLIEKVAKELNGWGVSPHALPVELEQRLCEDAERAIKAVGEWLMSAIPDDSADDVREALGL